MAGHNFCAQRALLGLCLSLAVLPSLGGVPVEPAVDAASPAPVAADPAPTEGPSPGPRRSQPDSVIYLAYDMAFLTGSFGPTSSLICLGFQASIGGFGVELLVGVSEMQYPDLVSMPTAWVLAGFSAFFSGHVDGFFLRARAGFGYGLAMADPRRGIIADAHLGWNFAFGMLGCDLVLGVEAGAACLITGGTGSFLPSLLYKVGIGW